MDARVSWVLNLDADFELAFGPKYAAKKSVRNAMKLHAKKLVGTLVHDGELVIDDETAPGAARGCTGRAFCPTPSALALLERGGATIEAHPSFEVLRAVNSRAFCASLGTTMPHASFETDFDAASAKLQRDPEIANAWRVKRSYGVAGRGQRLVRPGEDTSFLKSWIEEGGAQIEPNVEVICELGMHGMLTRDGALTTGALVTQTCDAAGAWIATSRVPHGEAHARHALLESQLNVVARALHAAGYFGPFGIDAFEYRARDGALSFQPRSEINARYSMGFGVGFA